MSEAKIKVLVAEDEVNLGQILSNFLSGRGCAVRTVTDGRAAVEALRAEAYDVALLDIVMPELDGLEVLKQVRAEADPPEVIIITGNGTIETAISAMKLGAYDYMAKPYRMAEIDVLVRRAWEKRRLARENVLLQSQLERVGGAVEIETQYAPLRAVLEMIARVAPSDSPVLITGESGTGKELVAHMLHRLSGRSGPFVDVGCASLAEGMLESELFGHERGAFPGADERKLGLMELAAGGTLFFDGIAELSPKLQSKLLRALDQLSFYRVGGTQKVEVDVRVLAATNRDLARLRRRGHLPRRPVLSHQHDRHRAAGAARSYGRRSAPRATVPQAVRPDQPANARPGCGRAARPLSVARQRARAAQCHGARRAARQGAADSRSGSAAASADAGGRRARVAARDLAGGAGATPHRIRPARDELAPGPCRLHARHQLEDALSEDP